MLGLMVGLSCTLSFFNVLHSKQSTVGVAPNYVMVRVPGEEVPDVSTLLLCLYGWGRSLAVDVGVLLVGTQEVYSGTGVS